MHLAFDPAHPAVLHYLDARARHGVYLGVLVGGDVAALAALPPTSPAPPRVARARKNEVAVFLEVDEATTRLLGWTPDELLGHRSLEFIHPDDRDRAIDSWMQLLSEPGVEAPPVRLRHRRRDGSWIWLEVTNQHRLAEALPIGVLQIGSDGAVAYTNERLGSILGTAPAPSADALLATVARGDRPSLATALGAALGDGIDADLEAQVRASPGARLRRCLFRVRALRDERGGPAGAVVCVEDVTKSAELRAELERRATHDLLTRVMNRASVMAALDGAIAWRDGGRTAAIFVDIDRFKEVNDRLGHLAGDEVLRTVADRLGVSVRGGDVLGRVGGDAFLVVCPGVRGPASARAIGERIARTVNQPIRLAGATLDIRVSVGVALSSRRVVNPDVLVRRADAAMYASKRAAAGQPVVYAAGMAQGPGARAADADICA